MIAGDSKDAEEAIVGGENVANGMLPEEESTPEEVFPVPSTHACGSKARFISAD